MKPPPKLQVVRNIIVVHNNNKRRPKEFAVHWALLELRHCCCSQLFLLLLTLWKLVVSPWSLPGPGHSRLSLDDLSAEGTARAAAPHTECAPEPPIMESSWFCPSDTAKWRSFSWLTNISHVLLMLVFPPPPNFSNFPVNNDFSKSDLPPIFFPTYFPWTVLSLPFLPQRAAQMDWCHNGGGNYEKWDCDQMD